MNWRWKKQKIVKDKPIEESPTEHNDTKESSHEESSCEASLVEIRTEIRDTHLPTVVVSNRPPTYKDEGKQCDVWILSAPRSDFKELYLFDASVNAWKRFKIAYGPEQIDDDKCHVCQEFNKVKTREAVNDYCIFCLKKYVIGGEKIPPKR
jgi:hypothetical protein